MALGQGTTTNSTGIDPGSGTYITSIETVEARVGIEAFDGNGHFQEAKRLRGEKTHTIKGYGEPSITAGLNSLNETDDGPFVDSVETEESGEQFDLFTVAGTEFVA